MITALCLALSAALSFTPTPSDMIPARMILIEVAQHGNMDRSDSYSAHGQCKRFQYDTFAEIAPDYCFADYPDVTLFMPHDHASEEESGRSVGKAWTMPDASEGNAFVEVAQFDYDPTLPKEENQRLAREFLTNIQAGDVMQMLARYNSGGRGTHTIMFTRPYDPRLENLYWADSNFANTRIDGHRYGYVRAYQCWQIEEVVDWLTKDWTNGATLYRVHADLVLRDDS